MTSATLTSAAEIFTDRRTVSTFSDQPVTDAELAQVWEYARYTPTAANTQPLRVLFVRTPEAKERLLAHVNDGNKPKVASAPVTAVLAWDPEYYEEIPNVFPHAAALRDTFANAPEVAESAGKLSSGIQIGGFIYAVRAAGLWAGPMTGVDAAGIDAEFFGENGWKTLVVVNIGHPGENPYFDRLPRVAEEIATQYV